MVADKTVGILLPDDGPDDYEWHTLEDIIPGLPRLPVGRIQSDGLHEDAALRALGQVQRLMPEAETLLSNGCDALIWACTSASFIGGLDWALAQSEELSQASGVPASSTSLAFREALDINDWRQINVLSPYPAAVTEKLVGFFKECGIDVKRVHSLDNLYASHSHGMHLTEEIRDFSKSCGEAKFPIILPDTAVNTLCHWQALSEATDLPVITANQVTLWKALKLINWSGPQPDCLAPLLE